LKKDYPFYLKPTLKPPEIQQLLSQLRAIKNRRHFKNTKRKINALTDAIGID